MESLEDREQLKGKVLAGIGWTASSRVISLMLQVVASTVVARHLPSADVGLVGFAGIFIGFVGRLTSFGVDAAVIQRKKLDERTLGTAFTLQALLGLAAFVMAVALAPLARSLIGHDGASGVVMALGIVFVLNALAFVPVCRLTRELSYGRLTLANMSRGVARGLLVIILIVTGFGFWGIVIADVLGVIVFLVGLRLAYPLVVPLQWDASMARSLLAFGSPLLGSSLLVFVLFNADNFMIGSLLGATMLGYYVLAFNWGSMICGILYETVNAVLYPAFAKMQEDIVGMRRLYLRTLENVGFVAVVVNTCLLAGAYDFLVVVQGRGSDKWLPSLACLQILAIYGIVRAFTEPVANVMMALGKTKKLLKANIVGAVVEVALMLPVLWWYGITGVAILVTVSYAAQLVVCVPFVTRELAVRRAELVGIVLPLAITSALSVGVSSMLVPQTLGASWGLFTMRVVVAAATLVLFHGMLTSFRMLRGLFELTSCVLRKAQRIV